MGMAGNLDLDDGARSLCRRVLDDLHGPPTGGPLKRGLIGDSRVL
jgi:hypothetical protein